MAELAVALGAATTLGNVAAVTQLVGNAGGLVSKINKEAKAARQNKVDCEHLASRVSTIGPILSRLPRDPEVAPPLAELNKVLKEADRLVVACQKGSPVFRASRQAEKFKEVNARILGDMTILILSLLSLIAHHERRQDVGELVSKITEAAEKVRRSKLDCKNLARSVSTIRGVLSRLPPDQELAQPLADLKNTLLEAHVLVVGCQRRRDALKQLFRVNRFMEINARINSHISVLSLSLQIADRRQ